MSAISGNNLIIFGDGTSLSSANIFLANIGNEPTNLSQFTNDLGNYGKFLDATHISLAYSGYYSASEYGPKYLYWDGNVLSINASNCNCNCNC